MSNNYGPVWCVFYVRYRVFKCFSDHDYQLRKVNKKIIFVRLGSAFFSLDFDLNIWSGGWRVTETFEKRDRQATIMLFLQINKNCYNKSIKIVSDDWETREAGLSQMTEYGIVWRNGGVSNDWWFWRETSIILRRVSRPDRFRFVLSFFFLLDSFKRPYFVNYSDEFVLRINFPYSLV